MMRRIKAMILIGILILSITGCGNSGGLGTAGSQGSGKEETVAEGADQDGKDLVVDGSGLFAGKDDDSETKGRWVEWDISPCVLGQIMMSPVKMNDGSYVFYGKKDSYEGQFTRFTTEDQGENWTLEALDWEQQTGGIIGNMSLLSDGAAVFSTMEVDESGNLKGMKWWQIVNDKPVEIESMRDQQPYATQLFDSNTLLCVGVIQHNGAETYLLDLTTDEKTNCQQLCEEYSGYLTGIAMDRSNPDKLRMYYTEYIRDGQTLSYLEQDGNVKKRVASIETGSGCGATDEEGNYYYVRGNGICRIANGGSIQEQIMENTSFQIGIVTNYVSGLTYVDDTTFFCGLETIGNGSETKLLKYEWSTEAKQKPASKILVWSLYQNPAVSMAVVEYNKSHPDSEAVYQIGVEDEMMDTENVIHQLNASLIAGTGPDVLVLDDLDYENYQKKGFLSNINEVVDRSSLLGSVAEPFYNANGDCYMLPGRFSVPVLMGDAGDVDRLKTMDDVQKVILACTPRPIYDLQNDAYYEELSPSERYAFGFISLDQMVDFVLRTSAPALIDDGMIHHDNLLKVMSFIQAVGGYYQINRYPDSFLSNTMCASGENMDMIVTEDGGYEFSITKHAQYGWGTLTTPAFFGEGKRDYRDEKLVGNVVIQPGLVEGPYMPSTIMGVASGSVNQDAAKEFVATVFGETVQNASFNDGNPVLKSALDTRMEKHREYLKENNYTGDMYALYNSLKTPVTFAGNMSSLRDCIIMKAKDMLDGKTTPESATSEIEQDMKLMLQEQQ